MIRHHAAMSGPVAVTVVILIVAGALASGVGLMLPKVSRRRNIKRAETAGALWSGLANFEATEAGQAPVVDAAVADVGRLYGSRFSRIGDLRPVGGVLLVRPDRVWWEPRIWLGRGRARGWELPAVAVRRVEVSMDRLGSYHAKLVTDDGDIRFLVVDPDGLQAAVHLLTG